MIEELHEIGLRSYEAKIYVALLEYGRMEAKQIAEKSGVPITAIYPNLKRLQEQGLVQLFEGEVQQVEAIAPQMALPVYIEKQKRELDEKRELLLREAEQIRGKKQILSEKEILTVSLGKKASSVIYQQTLTRARKTFFILGWHFTKVKEKYTFLREFREVMDRGVDVRIILTGPLEKNSELVQMYLQAGVKLRYHLLDNFSLLVVDGTECKITLKSTEYAEKFNVHMRDRAFAQAMNTYFLTLWRKGKEVG